MHSPFLPPGSPPFPETEGAKFRKALMGCLLRHDGFASRPPEVVQIGYWHSLLGTGDRDCVFGLHLPFLQAYTGETVRILQAELLKEFPHWALIIAPGCTGIDELWITTDRVVYEDRVIDDVDEFIAKLRLDEQRGRDATNGCELRQLAWLRPLLPGLTAKMNAGAPYAIVGTFDNYRGKRERIVVWVLSPSDVRDVMVGPVGEPPSQAGLMYPVESNGLLHDRRHRIVNGERVSIEAPYWLYGCSVPDSYTGDTLLVVDELNNTTDEIPYDRSQIIRDADLPRVPLP